MIHCQQELLLVVFSHFDPSTSGVAGKDEWVTVGSKSKSSTNEGRKKNAMNESRHQEGADKRVKLIIHRIHSKTP